MNSEEGDSGTDEWDRDEVVSEVSSLPTQRKPALYLRPRLARYTRPMAQIDKAAYTGTDKTKSLVVFITQQWCRQVMPCYPTQACWTFRNAYVLVGDYGPLTVVRLNQWPKHKDIYSLIIIYVRCTPIIELVQLPVFGWLDPLFFSTGVVFFSKKNQYKQWKPA